MGHSLGEKCIIYERAYKRRRAVADDISGDGSGGGGAGGLEMSPSLTNPEWI